MRVPSATLSLLLVACTPCGPFERTPESVCVPPGGEIREGTSFVLVAVVTARDAEDVSCSVAVDGGTISLIISGSDCPSDRPLGAAKALVYKVASTCEMPPLAAASYTVVPFGNVVNVGGDAGSGAPVCGS
jgi:hypothetical protein